MRIALILASNLSASPYVRYYIDVLDRVGVTYDIITWDRFGLDEPGVQAFNLKSRLDKGTVGKMLDSVRYCRFVKSRLLAANYDRLVVFTLQNALMLCPFLERCYSGRYTIDIRDYSVIKKLLGFRLPRAICHSAMTVISSHGYKSWLPQAGSYCVSHNTAICEPRESLARIEGQPRYKILTIGAIGYYEANRALIEGLADVPDFELEFVGSGIAEQPLKDFVSGRNIRNVAFKGRYAKEDEPRLLEGAAMMGILIDSSLNSRTCMSNRFYLSVVYGIPMIVDADTEQTKWVEQYGLGVVIDKSLCLREQLSKYLRTFDREKFDNGRKACLQVIENENRQFVAGFEAFIAR